MCLIALAWQAHPRYRLVLGANRDEFHDRPAAALGWWHDQPAVLGGRDLQAGGSWLAFGRTGRLAMVTNYREDLQPQAGVRSRGELVAGFVTGSGSPEQFARTLEGSNYAGFSVLAASFAGRGDSLAYVSNRGDSARTLPPGIYGLSNASLDTPWPKVLRSKARLATLLEAPVVNPAALLDLLADREPGSDDDIADVIADDLPPQALRAIAAPFVVMHEYGTRCSTVVLVEASGHVMVVERRFDRAGEPSGESQIEFDLAQSD
jgi:uncharacterized protein with NRDE domain